MSNGLSGSPGSPGSPGSGASGAAPDAPTAKDAAAPERFEELLGRLRALVERLEGGNLPLEDSLKAFEEGMALCKRGGLILDGAEKKVEMLLGTGSGGAAATAPFDMPEE